MVRIMVSNYRDDIFAPQTVIMLREATLLYNYKKDN